MYLVNILPDAIEDLKSIVAFIAQDNPEAGIAFGDALLNTALQLNALPYRGPALKKKPGVRKLNHGDYLIYYRVIEENRTVEILGFEHGSKAY
jgi:toxin ParE1/3/4